MKRASRKRSFVNSTVLFSTYRPSVPSYNYATAKTGDRTTPTTPSPHAARPNENLTQPQPSHANERDFLSHQYSDMYNVVKPKIKTTAQLESKNFGSAKPSKNAEALLKQAKSSTSAFIPADKAQRFARDLFFTAVQYDGQPSLLLEDLNTFSNSVKSDSYMNQMFKSSLTPVNIRRSALSQYLSETSFKSPLTAEALRVLSDIKALNLISTVTSSLSRLSDLNTKKLDINVTLAKDSEAERKRVTSELRAMIGDQATANFNFSVDPELISGLKAETMGQLLIDTSGRKGLEDEAARYMQRLDDEIARLKKIRSERYQTINSEAVGKREWSELLAEVNRLNKAGGQGGAAAGGQGAGSSQQGGQSEDGEDNERVRALTEIYKFKRAKN